MAVQTAAWQALVADLHLLNRVHNSPDFERSLFIIRDWVDQQGFLGDVRVLDYPAGSEINYWRVPPRWEVHEFRLEDTQGRVILDQSAHPLVVTPYSESFEGTLGRDELLEHVISRDDLPEAVPFVFRRMYRHWESGWSLALPKVLVESLNDDQYRVTLRTEHRNEPMQLLEYTRRGRTSRHVQLTAHLDHPGQCNDSLSGVVGALCAVRAVEELFPEPYFTFSVLIVPEIVGSSVYLAEETEVCESLSYCLCPNMLGHDAPLAICLSKRGKSQLDKACRLAAHSNTAEHLVGAWHKYPDCGDEISYDAPGLDIPASTVSRVGEAFPYYHSSLDRPETIDPGRFEEAVKVMADALGYLERNALPRARIKGLPALANPALDLYLEPRNMNNLLNPSADRRVNDLVSGEPVDLRLFQEFFLSNVGGRASLVDIALEFAIPFEFVESYARACAEKGLIELQQPVVDGDYELDIVQTARQRSGLLNIVER